MTRLQQNLMERLYHPVTFHVGPDQRIRDWEGDPQHYGFDVTCLTGQDITDFLPCLFGLSPQESICLNYVNIGDSHSTDVYLQPEDQGYSVVILDVTRLRDSAQANQQAANERGLLYQKLEDLTRALSERNSQLDEANRAKSLFISGMSHEFRTPMISILGHLKWLQRELPENSDYLRSARSIERNALYLLSLIDNLLSQGKIEAGQVENSPRAVKLDEFLAHLQDTLQPMANEKSLTLASCYENLPAEPVSVDEYHLHQILLNLLTNAIKYTPSGTVTLACEVHQEEMTLVVKDEGIGIPDDAIKSLFKPFNRAGNSSIAQGAGLGLSIVRGLVELMHGTLAIDSKVGKGTIVTLVIPIESPPSADINSDKTLEADEFRGLGPIFVLDDNPDILEIYKLFFSEARLDVEMFTSTDQFKQSVLTQHPPVVITDYHLGNETGTELIRQLRAHGFTGRIMMLTATTSIDALLHREAMKAGCDVFIPKPMEIDRLIERVREQLHHEQ